MDNNTVKNWCAALAYIYMLIGVVASFAMANVLGRSAEVSYLGQITYERNVILTIGIFLGVLFSTAIVSMALLALSKIMESIESIEYYLTEKPEKEDAEKREPTKNEWKCPSCGRINQSYVTTCICGEPKNRD